MVSTKLLLPLIIVGAIGGGIFLLPKLTGSKLPPITQLRPRIQASQDYTVVGSTVTVKLENFDSVALVRIPYLYGQRDYMDLWATSNGSRTFEFIIDESYKNGYHKIEATNEDSTGYDYTYYMVHNPLFL